MTGYLPSLVSYAILTLWLTQAARAADVNYQFNIINADTAPDGFTRNAALVNGEVTGTLIQANKEDTLHINVSVQLNNPAMRRSSSIHWHGLFQHKTASEDGPAMVTQCPISPGHAYTYDIPLRGQAGTFWYHSHLSTQYVDGIRGALVVYDNDDPHKALYDIDDANTVITLADWYHGFAPALQAKYFSKNNGGGKEPVPDSGLINGRGRFKNGPTVPRSVVSVTSGKRYRFRVVNVSAFAQYRFSIESHRMTIIEVDGISHKPLTVDAFDIYVAQRYSVVVSANQPVANYWIRSPMTVAGESDNKNLDAKNVFAVLHYEGAPNAEPKTKADSGGGGTLLKEQNLKALNLPVPGGSANADRVIDLDFTKDKDSSDAVEWTINGIKYEPPSLPTLLKIMANNATVESDFTTKEHTFVLNHNEVVDILIHGSLNGITHPFHLHGHAFHVIESSDGGGPNFVDPPVRDVVGVGGGGVRIRFFTDNPGPWFLHCHIDWHLEAGLAVVFAEAPQEQRTGPDAQILKDSWKDLCPIYNSLSPDEQ